MMILITGVSGHIGKRMAKQFLQDGINFIGIDCVHNPDLPEDKFHPLDIRDSSIGTLMEKNGVDSVIHLAFCTNPKIPAPTRDDIDLNGSKNIIDCSLQKGIKNIVFASSGRVYGDLQNEGGMHDRDGNYLNPQDDFYARNKIKAEELFLAAGDESGIRVAVLRLAIVCWKGGGAGLGDMFKSASKSGRFFTFGDKNPPIQLVHVNDVIDACRNALGKEGIFDIASEGIMPLTDLFTEAARLGGTKPSSTRLPEKLTLGAVSLLWKLRLCPIPPLYLKMYGYDITRDLSKTIGVLGKPRFTIQQILEEIVEG
ncbi:MAG: NAD-dependent epimerase/dehydratase family protein [Thermodesulfobacteriota bacterium]|nr:NAD-dependent epimerase/dehydratase family protein [Thermodesulfobacteriota bacterium]